VILADDDAGIRAVISRLLSPSCEVVSCVVDTDALVAAVPEVRPDVVVLDLSLPGRRTSFDVCRLLASGTPPLKVVILTGQDDPDLRAWAGESGAAGYVWKPRAAEELAQTIHAVLTP
jgi:DNA-binding NarL/FixJ family response regulator